jgi:hypothetical protein
MPYQEQKALFRQRTSTFAQATTENPVLLEGEKWWEVDAANLTTGRSKTGKDGSVVNDVIVGTAFNDLPFDPVPGGGSGSGSGAYIYQQSTPATTWTINHNLGYRPSVELLDSGSQEIDGGVSHPTVNQTVVTLSPATAGLARLI